MAVVQKGKYQSTPPSGHTNGEYEFLQVDDNGNLKIVARSEVPEDFTVLAKATGSEDGMGKIATLASTETVYIRCDCSDQAYAAVDWIVNTDAKVDLSFYVAREVADEVTATLSSFVDTDTIVINGLTYTGESTAGDAAWASRKFLTETSDTADAAELAACINADYAVTTAGTSVAGTDKLTITTDEGAHTITAAAAADYDGGKYGLSATVATELASIVLAINHKDNITCASSVDDDTVTINDIVFTSAAAEDKSAREFDNDASDNATATSLAACINDSTYGVDGVTASVSSNVVSLARDSQSDTITLTTSSATTLATESAGGVPGVTAEATGATGELGITPTWTETLTVAEAGDQLTVVKIDNPGVLAAADTGVVTLSPGTPAGTSGDLALLIQAVPSAHCTIAQTGTTGSLYLVDETNNVAANNTTGGTINTVPVNGYEYAYLGIYADGTTPTVVVSAAKRTGAASAASAASLDAETANDLLTTIDADTSSMATLLGTIDADTSILSAGFTTKTRVTKAVDYTASQTAQTIWDPTGGTSFVITSITISASSAGAVTIFDNTDAAGNYVFDGTLGTYGGWSHEFSAMHWKSAAADNILKYTTGAGAAGTICVTGYELA